MCLAPLNQITHVLVMHNLPVGVTFPCGEQNVVPLGEKIFEEKKPGRTTSLQLLEMVL